MSDWSSWGKCDQQCGSGRRKKTREIWAQAEGEGLCWEKNDPLRLEFENCNTQTCESLLPVGREIVECDAKLDVMLLLDGSGSLTQTGWDATKNATKKFIEAMHLAPDKVEVAVLLFSGPSNFWTMLSCMRGSSATKSFDTMAQCSLQWVSKLTPDMGQLMDSIDNMQWPKGTTLTHLALQLADMNLMEGRSDASSVVIVVTDGVPQDPTQTFGQAAHLSEKLSNLVWVPVGWHAPAAEMKKWSTELINNKVVEVKEFEQLAAAGTLNQIIADMCPAIV